MKSEDEWYRAYLTIPLLWVGCAVFCFLCVLAGAQPSNHDSVNAARFASAEVPKHRLHEVQVITQRIEKNRARYEGVSKSTGVPWYVIASLHNMEAGGDFTKHLHEGSTLKWRTRDVPKGRPKPPAQPPFSWEFSATDALLYDKMHLKNWKDTGASLSACEGYNGWGYAKYHPATPSPYLWAGTTVERPGKYVADGKWSSTARSGQIGVAAIWKLLAPR